MGEKSGDIDAHSIANNGEPGASNDKNNGIQLTATQQGRSPGASQQSGTQGNTIQAGGNVGEVPGYSETGTFSWRKANDQLFINLARQYNEEHHLSPKTHGTVRVSF